MLGLLLAAVAMPATAEVYRWRDAQGGVHYGDAPPEDRPAERLELSPDAAAPDAGKALREQERALSREADERARREAARREAEDAQAAREAQRRERDCTRARERLARAERALSEGLAELHTRKREQALRDKRDAAQAEAAEHCQ